MSIRTELNKADPNRIPDALRSISFGDLLNRLLGGSDVNIPVDLATADAATQTGAYVQADVQSIATLANAIKAKLNLLLAAVRGIGGVTEQGVTVTSNVATLANQPSAVVSVIATTGTTTGSKTLLQGPISGAGAIVPASGQVVWDGGKKILFAAVDAITVADFAYTTAADATVTALQRDIGQNP